MPTSRISLVTAILEVYRPSAITIPREWLIRLGVLTLPHRAECYITEDTFVMSVDGKLPDLSGAQKVTGTIETNGRIRVRTFVNGTRWLCSIQDGFLVGSLKI